MARRTTKETAIEESPEPTPIRAGLPRRRKPVPKPTASPGEEEALALARRIVELAEDKKASDIVLLEIGGLTTLADYFVICSGQSDRQLGAVVDGIVSALRDEGIKPIGREGKANAHWLLIDYGSVIVHVMAPPERDFYQLEKLWADAPLLLRLQ
ncbi:MAG: ribosome-associated protein [Chloroflexota bacterium]|nr:ribosome-associated protein [Chloroflexota bacterium]